MQRITVTSAELRDTSTQMTTAAANVGEEFRRMMAKVQELTASWTGQAASGFEGFYRSFNTNWSQCEEALQGISQLLSSSAEAYESTEQGIAGQFSG